MRYWEADRFEGDEELRELRRDYEQSLSEGSVPYLDADELTDLAEFYYSRREDDKAQAAIDWALQLYPEALAPVSYLVHNLLSREKWEEARQMLAGIDNVENDREIMYLNVELHLHDGEPRKAAEMLNANFPASDTDDEQRTYMREVISLLLDYEGKEVERMLQEWGTRLERMSGRTEDDNLMLADMFSCVNRHSKAIDLLTRVIEDNPYSARAWTLMIDVYCRAGKNDRAIEAAEYAMAIDDHNIRSVMAHAWLKAEKYSNLRGQEGDHKAELKRLRDECLRSIEWARKCGADEFPDCFISMAETWTLLDEPQKASQYMQRYLQADPENPYTLFLVSMSAMDNCDFKAALGFLQRLEAVHPAYDKSVPAKMAWCHFMLGDCEQAVECVYKALDISPSALKAEFDGVFPCHTTAEYPLLIRQYFAAESK